MAQSFDTIIIGAGMVGTTIACLLAKQGLTVALIDKNPLPKWPGPATISSPASRVSALNHGSVSILSHIDTWPAVQNKSAYPYEKMEVFEANSLSTLQFDAEQTGFKELGHIIENAAVVTTHLERLSQNYSVEIFDSREVSQFHNKDDCIQITLSSGQPIEGSLVIGADGANSPVRGWLDTEIDTHDFQQQAIVAKIQFEHGHQNTAWQCFLGTGPIAMLPMEDHCCSMVWSSDNDVAMSIAECPDEAFLDQINAIFRSRLGRALQSGERRMFPLFHQHAKKYVGKRSVLIGDAAHVTHPLAGLGANIGLQDAAALAEVIADAKSQRRNIGNHSVLRRYERWRKGENARVLLLMRGIKSVFAQSDPGFAMLRQGGLHVVNQFPELKNQLSRHAMGIAGDLPAICRTRR